MHFLTRHRKWDTLLQLSAVCRLSEAVCTTAADGSILQSQYTSICRSSRWTVYTYPERQTIRVRRQTRQGHFIPASVLRRRISGPTGEPDLPDGRGRLMYVNERRFIRGMASVSQPRCHDYQWTVDSPGSTANCCLAY